MNATRILINVMMAAVLAAAPGVRAAQCEQSPSPAQPVYVDPQNRGGACDDNGPGTLIQPLCTFAQGLRQMADSVPAGAERGPVRNQMILRGGVHRIARHVGDHLDTDMLRTLSGSADNCTEITAYPEEQPRLYLSKRMAGWTLHHDDTDDRYDIWVVQWPYTTYPITYPQMVAIDDNLENPFIFMNVLNDFKDSNIVLYNKTYHFKLIDESMHNMVSLNEQYICTDKEKLLAVLRQLIGQEFSDREQFFELINNKLAELDALPMCRTEKTVIMRFTVPTQLVSDMAVDNNPDRGDFYYDFSTQQLYVRMPAGYPVSNPNQVALEVGYVIHVHLHMVEYLKISGLEFRYAGSGNVQGNWALLTLGPGSILENSIIHYADAGAVAIHENTIVRNNILSHNGNSGVGGGAGDYSVIEGNEISYNNWRRYQHGWHAGGIKLIPNGSFITIRNNRVTHNQGMGIWLDHMKEGNIIENNRLAANHWQIAGVGQFPQIFIEFTNLPEEITEEPATAPTIIRNNIVSRCEDPDNRQAGIGIRDSSHTKVYHNLVNGCFVGLQAGAGLYPLDPMRTTLWTDFYNNIVLNSSQYPVQLQYNRPNAYKNTSDYNLYWNYDGTELQFWDDTNVVIDFSAWQALGFDQNTIVADPRLANPAQFNFHLTSQSPAIDAGREMAGRVDLDIEGRPRPQRAGWDIGPYEQPEPCAPARYSRMDGTLSADFFALELYNPMNDSLVADRLMLVSGVHLEILPGFDDFKTRGEPVFIEVVTPAENCYPTYSARSRTLHFPRVEVPLVGVWPPGWMSEADISVCYTADMTESVTQPLVFRLTDALEIACE